MMIPQNKNVRQLVCSAVEGRELHCYNTEGNRNSVVGQTKCKMDVIRLEQRAYIKIAAMRGRNARECHSELVEAVESNVHLATVL